MIKPTNAENKKRKSRGWSDSMDSASIAQRLAVVGNLYACWNSLKKARPMGRPESPTTPLAAEKLLRNS
jgi:hypothetical protein